MADEYNDEFEPSGEPEEIDLDNLPEKQQPSQAKSNLIKSKEPASAAQETGKFG